MNDCLLQGRLLPWPIGLAANQYLMPLFDYWYIRRPLVDRFQSLLLQLPPQLFFSSRQRGRRFRLVLAAGSRADDLRGRHWPLSPDGQLRQHL